MARCRIVAAAARPRPTVAVFATPRSSLASRGQQVGGMRDKGASGKRRRLGSLAGNARFGVGRYSPIPW